jgi:hypothetical protein
MAPATKSLRFAHGILSRVSPLAPLRQRRRRDLERISLPLAGVVAA